MNNVTPSAANTGVEPGPKPDDKVDVGNFKLRRVVSKCTKLLINACKHSTNEYHLVDLTSRKVEPLRSCDRKLTIHKQIRKTAAHLLKRSSAALFHDKTEKPKINSDGDQIPDSKTLHAAKTFSKSSDDLTFVLSKIQFHKKNEDNLNKRSEFIKQLKSTPDSKELQENIDKLDKAIGGYYRELNEVLLSGFLSKVRHLLKDQGKDSPDTSDIARLLGDKDQSTKFSLAELNDLLNTDFNSDGDQIPEPEAFREAVLFSQSGPSSNNLAFVLSKVQYHKKNEDNLNKRSESIRQLMITPNSKKLKQDKANLDKAVGGYCRELNDVLLSGFLSKARDLLKGQGEDNPATRDIARLLGDEDQSTEFSLPELNDLLKKNMQRIQEEQKKPRAAGAA